MGFTMKVKNLREHYKKKGKTCHQEVYMTYKLPKLFEVQDWFLFVRSPLRFW